MLELKILLNYDIGRMITSILPDEVTVMETLDLPELSTIDQQ